MDIIVFIVLIIGLVILIKGDFKISDSNRLVRPQSTWFGVIITGMSIFQILFAFSLFGYSALYLFVHYISLILISIFFLSKAQKIVSIEAVAKSSATKKHLLILIGFILIMAVISYFVLN